MPSRYTLLLFLFIPLLEWILSSSKKNPLLVQIAPIKSSFWKTKPFFLLIFTLSSLLFIWTDQIQNQKGADQFYLFFDIEDSNIDSDKRASLAEKIARTALPLPVGFGFFSTEETDFTPCWSILPPTVHPLFLELVAGNDFSKKMLLDTARVQIEKSSTWNLFISSEKGSNRLFSKIKSPFILCDPNSLRIIAASDSSLSGKMVIPTLHSLAKELLNKRKGEKNSFYPIQFLWIFLAIINYLSLLQWARKSRLSPLFYNSILLFFLLDQKSLVSNEATPLLSPQLHNQKYIEAEKKLLKNPLEVVTTIESRSIPILFDQNRIARALLSKSYAYLLSQNCSGALSALLNVTSFSLPFEQERFFYTSSLLRELYKQRDQFSTEDVKNFLLALERVIKEAPEKDASDEIRSERLILRELFFQEKSALYWDRELVWPFFWIDSILETLPSEQKKACLGAFLQQHIAQVAPILKQQADRYQIGLFSQKIELFLAKKGTFSYSTTDLYEMVLITLLTQAIRERKSASSYEVLDSTITTLFLELIRLTKLGELFPQNSRSIIEKKRVCHSWIIESIQNFSTNSTREKNLLQKFQALAAQENWVTTLPFLEELLALWKITIHGIKLPLYSVDERLASENYDDIETIIIQISQVHNLIEEVESFLPFSLTKSAKSTDELISILLEKWIAFSPINGSAWASTLESKELLLKKAVDRAFFAIEEAKKNGANEISPGMALCTTRALQSLFFAQFLGYQDPQNHQQVKESVIRAETLISNYQKMIEQNLQKDPSIDISTIIALIKNLQKTLNQIETTLFSNLSVERLFQELGKKSELIAQLLLPKEKRENEAHTSTHKEKQEEKEMKAEIEEAVQKYRELDLRDRTLFSR